MAKGRRLHPRSGRGEPLKPAACRGHRKTHGAEVNLAHGKPAGGLRRAHRMGPGTRRPPGAGARALNPRGRIPGASGESGCWSWPPAGAAATCLLARRELARVRALTAGGFGSPCCNRWDQLSFARSRAPQRRPQTLQLLKVAKRLDVAGGSWGG